jgi:hypothetical protein
MEAALPEHPQLRSGTSRILAHCAGVARITGDERASARARIESAIGDDLTRRLFGVLVADDRHERSRRLS